MVKKNYAAWNVDSRDFKSTWRTAEKMEFFARYAVLSPSGHNSQPWKLSFSGERLLLSINPDHHLSSDGSGLLSVEPYISLGTFIETYRLAARGFGYDISIDLFPDGSSIAAFGIGRPIPPESELLEAIVRRTSNRNPYSRSAIDAATLKALVSSDLPGVTMTTVTARRDIGTIAKLTEQAVRSIMSNPRYRKELSAWVRTNISGKFDGMPGFTHGFGAFKSLLSKAAVRYAPQQGPQAQKSAHLINESGALVIVGLTSEDRESFVNAGRLYSRICILATSSGLASSALGAAVIDPDTRESVKSHFGLKERPVYILRLGKTDAKAPHSPRWPLEKVLS
jgi:nitroreductase